MSKHYTISLVLCENGQEQRGSVTSVIVQSDSEIVEVYQECRKEIQKVFDRHEQRKVRKNVARD